ncbi:hypothetical protein [Nocardioides sp. T2.26MG-1]|uniref:hypothetical protein n=1 Tax=Nocardioides sp. T2.26MG-1 TaxID=3041166 RepID=UPI0024776AB1|nr:hypothetical protein [Nocardioides sp. T2.26MG-1]CAI9414037.1 hypothetical protein HIDPHFAB_02170 [Nocardioides sp. T2.26MG-1]
MNTLGRAVLLSMIPVNVLVIAWIAIGRVAYGVIGWFWIILLVTAVPLALIALLVTTVLAWTQHGRPRSLTGLQAAGQLVTWAGLVVFGAFMPDFGDTDDSQVALLTQAFGYSDSLFELSFLVSTAGAVVAIAGYIVLLSTLSFVRRPAPAPPAGRPRGGATMAA